MKKQIIVISGILVLFVQFLVFAPFVNAAGETIINIPAGSYSAAPGGTIIIPVNIDVSGSDVLPTDISWNFTFNPADIASIDWFADSQEANSIYGSCSFVEEGNYLCASGSSGIAEFASGEIQKFQITLTETTTADSTDLTFSNILASNEMGDSISVPIIASPSVTSLTINQLDVTAPTFLVSAPSLSETSSNPVTYTITYTGADTVTLSNSDVVLNKTGSADGVASVSGTGTTTRTVTVSSITGNGTLGISINAGTASDTALNNALAYGPSATFTVTNVVADTTAPTVPSGLSATAISTSEINLSWTASVDAVGVTGYKVYRAGVQIGTSTSTSYPDTGLSVGTAYSYTVSAYDAQNNVSAQSSSASATTQILAQTPTPAPVSSGGGGGGGGGSSSRTSRNNITSGQILSAVMVKSLSPISNTLSFGSKGADVLSLQTFLEQKGYLAQGNVTGFFGNLTLLALQKYQCNKGIVCEGNAISTGWGNLGKKTLTFINQDIQIMNQGGGNSVSTISGLDSLLGGRSISSLSNQELKDLIQKLTAMVLQLQIKLLQMKLGN